MSLLNPFEHISIPFANWINDAVGWLVTNYRPVFQAVKVPFDATLGTIESTLQGVPPLVLIAVLFLIAWQAGGLGLAAALSLIAVLVGVLGMWIPALTTMAIVFTSLLVCIIIGIPLGILAAKNDTFERIIRPLLDGMQTIPSFVYLVPVVMLFGIGNVPGVIVTIIFAVSPLIRLTNLGIREVPASVKEAVVAFGGSPMQLLFKVELPLAVRTIMAGVNQTLMMSLSMSVIASMIAVGGLGKLVLQGIGRLDVGIASVAGLGIVLLAIILDRLTQAVAEPDRGQAAAAWSERGPIGLLRRLIGRGGAGEVGVQGLSKL